MAIRNKEELKEWWSGKLSKLVGRQITQIMYMSDVDANRMGWNRCPIVIVLDDGTTFSPLQDEEGNGPGALEITPGSQTGGISRIAPPI